jgi:DNA polymerase-3 subunit alpha
MLGQYVSDHPLLGMERLLRAAADTPISRLPERSDGSSVKVAGILSKLTKKFTRGGDVYVVADLEDLEGAVECVFFPKVYQQAQGLLAADRVVVVGARVDLRDETPKLIAMQVGPPPETADDPAHQRVELLFDAHLCDPPTVEKLKGILRSHRGHSPVLLRIRGATKTMTVKLGDEYRVDPRNGLWAEIKQHFGPTVIAS